MTRSPLADSNRGPPPYHSAATGDNRKQLLVTAHHSGPALDLDERRASGPRALGNLICTDGALARETILPRELQDKRRRRRSELESSINGSMPTAYCRPCKSG